MYKCTAVYWDLFYLICRMSFYFSCLILRGLCSHSSSGAAEMLHRLLRGPRGPPAGSVLDRGQRLWSRFQMFPSTAKEDPPKRRWSQNSIRLGLSASGRALLAGGRLVLWERFGRDSMSMNYWRISNDDDGQAFVFAPSPPGCGQNRADAPLVQLVWFFWEMTVMMIKWWHHLYSWTNWDWLLWLIFRLE